MHCVSEKRKKNAQDAAGCVEDLGRYFCYAKDETGTKQYLGVFAMMSLLQCFHLLSCQLFLMLRNAVETTFATSWGPAAAVNFLIGRQVLRDYSPQGLTRGSSVKVPDKRLATVAFLILIHTELGKVISAIFKALGMPHSFAACLSFLFCELRKYFGTNVKKYRPGFQDKSKRDEFVALLSEFGEDVGSWLTNAGEDCFITWSDDDDDE